MGDYTMHSEWERRAEEWLESAEPDPVRLQAWLEGSDGAGSDPDELIHPYFLRLCGGNPDRRYRLAKPVRRLLEDFRAAKSVSNFRPALLYELFYLASGLQMPAVLASPLRSIYEEPGPVQADLDGTYDRVPLIRAFRSALSENQYSYHLLGVWKDMLEGRPHTLLKGNPGSGFEGLLGLPDEEPGDRKKKTRELESGLTQFVRWIDKSPAGNDSKRRELAFMINRTKGRCGDLRLDWRAKRDGWPRWSGYGQKETWNDPASDLLGSKPWSSAKSEVHASV